MIKALYSLIVLCKIQARRLTPLAFFLQKKEMQGQGVSFEPFGIQASWLAPEK